LKASGRSALNMDKASAAPPLLDPEAASSKVTELAARIEPAFQRNKAISKIRTAELDARIKSIAVRYAMMATGEVNRHPERPPAKTSEQELKREIIRFRNQCVRFLNKPSEAKSRQLAAATYMSAEAAQGVPELLFHLSALRDGTISRGELEGLIVSADEAIGMVPEADRPVGDGPQVNIGASATAQMLAADFYLLTGKMPTFGGDRKDGVGPFEVLVSDVFEVMGVKASGAGEARKAVSRLKENRSAS
jgi:hypothetical protein